VTRVAFSNDNQYVISAGGQDKTVMVWKTDFGDEDSDDDAEPEDRQALEELLDAQEDL